VKGDNVVYTSLVRRWFGGSPLVRHTGLSLDILNTASESLVLSTQKILSQPSLTTSSSTGYMNRKGQDAYGHYLNEFPHNDPS
jgi:hypothetical protein